MVINKNKKFCYRITHIQNLPTILTNGLVHKEHKNASNTFISIGNLEIIGARSTTPVRIPNYGNIGDYVPFYFTPRSMMLYNIITGYKEPLVPKRKKEEIVIIRCSIEDLCKLNRFFFTNGQANDLATKHYNNLTSLHNVDWESIQQSKFDKADGDYERPRRYQAEFLVFNQVPVNCFESLCVYNKKAETYVKQELLKAGIENLPINIYPPYFFD